MVKMANLDLGDGSVIRVLVVKTWGSEGSCSVHTESQAQQSSPVIPRLEIKTGRPLRLAGQPVAKSMSSKCSERPCLKELDEEH